MGFRRRILIACAMLSGFAWTGRTTAQEYPVHIYTEDDGLPSSSVRAVRQAPDGRMVFGSRLGVTFYDGLEWDHYGETEGLDPADPHFIEYDSAGTLWVVVTGFVVQRFDGERWSRLPPPPALPTDGTAIHAFALFEGDRVQPLLALGSGTYRWDGRRWDAIVTADGRPAPRARALLVRGDRLWLGTDGGLWTAGADFVAEPVPVNLPGPVLGLGAARCDDGESPCLWAAGWDWASLIRGREQVRLGCGEPLRFSHVPLPLDLLEDGRGGLFVASPVELFRLGEDACPQKIGRLNGLAADGVQDLCRDDEGNLWTAGMMGVSKIVGFDYATYRQRHGLFEDEVTSVVERPDGSFVFGHRGGITIRRGERWSVRAFAVDESQRPGARIVEMARTPDGTIWIAAYDHGLGRLDDGDRLDWVRDAGLVSPVSSVTVDAAGAVWLLADNTLWRRTGGRFEIVYELPHPVFGRRVAALRDGRLALATSNSGVVVLAGGEVRWIQALERRWNDVYSIAELADGTVLVGTAAGVGRVDGFLIRPLDLPGLGTQRPVYSILEDRNGAVWLGTDNGVVIRQAGRARRVSVDDGLGGRETNRDALLLDSAGNVWIGTAQGVTVYRPSLARSPAGPPRVELLEILAGGRSSEPPAVPELRAPDDDVIFRFAAISMRDERRLRIRTRLEGGEEGWTEHSAPTREVHYVGLSPGRYRFHVQAALPGGSWSEPASSGWIRIRPPFWRQGRFVALSVAALIGIAAALQRHLAQRKYSAKLEAEVDARARELHHAQAELSRIQRLESLGLLAGGIAHDFNNLLTVILGNLSLIARRGDRLDSREYVASRTAIRRARELTAQLLTFSRGGEPSRHCSDLRPLVREALSLSLAGSSTRAELDLEPDLRAVEIDPAQINQVLQNLLINAVQAMPAGGVVRVVGRNVTSAPDPLGPGDYVELSVIDDGPGIPSEDLPRVFEPFFSTKAGGSGLGLASAWSIVRRHDGLLTAESPGERGAAFHLYLPSADPGAQPVVAPPAEEPPGGANASAERRRILVMDDDPAVLEVTCSMLEHLGHRAVAVAHGEAAVAAYRERPEKFDAVILDLTVSGGMGGEETLRRLRAIDPDVRAIVASGYSNDPVMARYRDYGFVAGVAKPFRVEQLDAVLRTIL